MLLSPARLANVLNRFDEVEARMGAAADPTEIVRLSKEHASLRPAADAIRAWKDAEAQKLELEMMLLDLPSDDDMAKLARLEIDALADKIPDLANAVQMLLLPKDKDDEASVILEVRAGTGGEEAALFAADLFRMYQRYAAIRGWRFEVESVNETGLQGLREATASITGEGVFGRLKFESGVHRVQRVPETEAGGRVHTSAATVAVLPQPEDVELVINDNDIRIDTMRSSGAGGQHVNKTDSAVRMTHLPTGIVVVAQEKSQHQNRANAMKVLRARLYEMERQKLADARAADRKGQVGSGDRSERIRTYNFPQGRVTDHRINMTLYNIDLVIDGSALDDVIAALIADDQAARLAEMNAADG